MWPKALLPHPFAHPYMDENEDVEEGDAEHEGGESVENAAQRDARIKKRKEEEERRELARRSEVIRRGLPRPANVDVPGLFETLLTATVTKRKTVVDC